MAREEPSPSAQQPPPVAAPPATPLLVVERLTVLLPDGRPVLRDLDLVVEPGEIVAILGGSGAGKTTLARAIFERELLTRKGFRVKAARLEARSAALVPQRGAPFDHLDVRGNIALPLAWQKSGDRSGDPASWLALVGLPAEMAKRGWPPSRLSGGQSQRLAVARALAAGRSLLVLDEPSAGLDPRAARELAELLRSRAKSEGEGYVLVTHDTRLAAAAADRYLFLDPSTGGLVPLEAKAGDRDGLEKILDRRLDETPNGAPPPRRPLVPAIGAGLARLWRTMFGALEVPPVALAELRRVTPRRIPHLLRVVRRVAKQALFRPALFYAVVASLLGFTVLYVLIRSAPAGMSSERILRLLGGAHVVALTPPLAAILFVATSGSAVGAWLGSMSLTRQIAALRALGVRPETYLWMPAFLMLVAAFFLTAVLFATGMIAGGVMLYRMQGIPADFLPTMRSLAGDFLDPEPERADLRTRAFWLVGIYGPLIAADVVWRGTSPKETGDDVTRGMTGSVIAGTLWVVVLELVSSLILFQVQGARG